MKKSHLDNDPCGSTNPCLNNGICYPSESSGVCSYSCQCLPSYEGPNCENSNYNFCFLDTKAIYRGFRGII